MTIEQRRTIAACCCCLRDGDARDGTSVSLETQAKILGDHCREHSMEVFGFCRDDGYTGIPREESWTEGLSDIILPGQQS